MENEELIRRVREGLARFTALPLADQLERLIDWRLDEIQRSSDDWHCLAATRQHDSLHDALGMTWEEYVEFAVNPRRFVVRHYLTDEAAAEARAKEAP